MSDQQPSEPLEESKHSSSLKRSAPEQVSDQTDGVNQHEAKEKREDQPQQEPLNKKVKVNEDPSSEKVVGDHQTQVALEGKTSEAKVTSAVSSSSSSSTTEEKDRNRKQGEATSGGDRSSRSGFKARGGRKGRNDPRGDRNRDSSKTSSDGRGGAHSAGGKEEGQEEEVEEEDAASSSRLPKRKVSVFFGYCGIGYSGLQINPGVKTIEGDIFEAFCKAGAVSKENAVNPNKVGLTRAARTDRGVHAAGNLLSLKLILEPPLPEGYAPGSLVEYVNTLLPPFIRIWGLTRVQNGFNARTNCDSRLYEYLLPTYVFLPPKPASSMWEMIKRMRDESKAEGHGEGEGEEGSDAQQSLDSVLDHPFWNEQGSEQDFASDVKSKKKWRMPKEKLEHVRKIFSKYEGSHNFHNFTVGKEFRDRSAQRFMKKLSVSDPKIINGTEWVSIKFHGQSFMLHQIRKMIGLLVLVARTNAPPSLIPETYGPARIHVPKAPGLGLLLEEPLFGGYNQRIAENNRRIEKLGRKADEDMKRDPVEYTAYKEQMEAFKQTFIYDRIMIQEEETSEFAKWLNYLDVFQGPDFEYLNPKGVIPPQCVLKVGEKRREPGGQPKTSKASSSEQVEGKPEQEGSDSEDELDGVNQAELEG